MSVDIFELNVLQKSAPILTSIEKRGYRIIAPEDFSQVPGLVSQTGRIQQTPMLSVTENDFTLGNAFYLFLQHEGRAIGGAASRLIDLHGESFETYIRRSSQYQYHRDADPIATVARPVAQEIGGQIIYLGELQFSEEHRGNPLVLGNFVRLLQALSALKWPNFDWMYAFVPRSHAKLASLYGFTWQIPNAITWKDPAPRGRKDDHCMLAISKPHFDHVWRI